MLGLVSTARLGEVKLNLSMYSVGRTKHPVWSTAGWSSYTMFAGVSLYCWPGEVRLNLPMHSIGRTEHPGWSTGGTRHLLTHLYSKFPHWPLSTSCFTYWLWCQSLVIVELVVAMIIESAELLVRRIELSGLFVPRLYNIIVSSRSSVVVGTRYSCTHSSSQYLLMTSSMNSANKWLEKLQTHVSTLNSKP